MEAGDVQEIGEGRERQKRREKKAPRRTRRGKVGLRSSLTDEQVREQKALTVKQEGDMPEGNITQSKREIRKEHLQLWMRCEVSGMCDSRQIKNRLIMNYSKMNRLIINNNISYAISVSR